MLFTSWLSLLHQKIDMKRISLVDVQSECQAVVLSTVTAASVGYFLSQSVLSVERHNATRYTIRFPVTIVINILKGRASF